MKENLVLNKSKDFTLRIIKLYKYLGIERKEYVLSKQILRSGTSVGANIKEAIYAQSKPDFYSKLHIAYKEANETEYWLELLFESDYINENQFISLNTDNKEIIKLLTAILKTKNN